MNRPGKDFAEANPNFSEKVREQFAQVLASRSMSVRDFADPTEYEFDDADSMYAFLAAVFEYLFEGVDDHNPWPPLPDSLAAKR